MTDPPPPPPRLFSFGHGYTAARFARRLAARGFRVAGTARDPTRVAALRQAGVDAVPFEGETGLADPAGALAGTTHLLTSIPPGEAGCPVLARHLDDIRALTDLVWVGVLSTTGVYGNTDGAWVDEDTPPNPSGARGKRRVAMERAWLDTGLPVHVFRLAGIYGPGRSAIDQVRRGRARRLIKPGHVFSRIHVDDIAAVLEASLDRPDPGTLYNVCDDEPEESARVIEEAARLLGVEPPPAVPFEEAELSPMARSFYADCRRVRNDRIKRELGVRLAYPSYREGLAAQLAAERGG